MSDYDAGHLAGRIDERLAGHDKHFAKINGSIERHARAIENNTVTLHELVGRTGQVESRLVTNVRLVGMCLAIVLMLFAVVVFFVGLS